MFRHEIETLTTCYYNLLALDPNPRKKTEYAKKIERLETLVNNFDNELKDIPSPIDFIGIPPDLSNPKASELHQQVNILLSDKIRKGEDLLKILEIHAPKALYKIYHDRFNELKEQKAFNYEYTDLAAFINSIPLPRVVVITHAELLQVLADFQTNTQQKEKYLKQREDILIALSLYDISRTKSKNVVPFDDSFVCLSYDHHQCNFNYEELAQQIRVLEDQDREQKAEKKRIAFTKTLTETRAAVKKLYEKLGDLSSNEEQKKQFYNYSEELSGNLNDRSRTASWGWTWDSQEELDGLLELKSKLEKDITDKQNLKKPTDEEKQTPVQAVTPDPQDKDVKALRKKLSDAYFDVFNICNRIAKFSPGEEKTYQALAVEWLNKQFLLADNDVTELDSKNKCLDQFIATLEVKLRIELKKQYKIAAQLYGELHDVVSDKQTKTDYIKQINNAQTKQDDSVLARLDYKGLIIKIEHWHKTNAALENTIDYERSQLAMKPSHVAVSVVPNSVFNASANAPLSQQTPVIVIGSKRNFTIT